jgi:hypothetical protein
MTKKTKKIFLVSVVAVIVIAAVTGYMMWNKPHKNVQDADAVKITAVDLYNSFITDSAKANTLYADKVVLVSGEVIQLALNQQAQQVILVKTAVTGAFINCTMEVKTVGFKTGDSIAIKGICSGYISGDIEMGLPGDVFLVRAYPFNGK